MAYDYNCAVKEDCIDAIRDMIASGSLDTTDYLDRDELAEHLNDELWADDSVTGNGSGSYTFNIREYYAETVLDHFMDDDWEWFDMDDEGR